jgi:hypothetical protein
VYVVKAAVNRGMAMAVLYRASVVPPGRPHPRYSRAFVRYVSWRDIEWQLVLSFAHHSNLPCFRGMDTRGVACLQGL